MKHLWIVKKTEGRADCLKNYACTEARIPSKLFTAILIEANYADRLLKAPRQGRDSHLHASKIYITAKSSIFFLHNLS